MKDWLYFKHQCSNQTPKDVVKLPYNFVTLVHKIYSLVYSLKIILCHFHSPCLQGFVMRFSHLRVLWVLRHGWQTDAQAWRCTCCCTLGHGLHTSCISDCSGLWKAPEQICVIIFCLDCQAVVATYIFGYKVFSSWEKKEQRFLQWQDGYPIIKLFLVKM